MIRGGQGQVEAGADGGVAAERAVHAIGDDEPEGEAEAGAEEEGPGDEGEDRHGSIR